MKDNSFQAAIKSYLDERAKADELFAKAYNKENKSIDECCSYILGEAKKRGNAVAISDAEVFGMAVHYYDEDNIKVEKIPANTGSSVSGLSASTVLTEKDKEKAREAALRRLEEETVCLAQEKAYTGKERDNRSSTDVIILNYETKDQVTSSGIGAKQVSS